MQLFLGAVPIILRLFCYFPDGTFCTRQQPHSSRANHLQLHVPFAHTNACLYSFVPHTTSLWNSLPHEVVSASSVRSFKRNLCSQK